MAPFDCHLMIVEPERWAIRYAEGRRRQRDVPRRGGRATRSRWPATSARPAPGPGLAIDRDTPVEPYLDLLPHFDLLLIMTIKAGFGGQEFLPELLDKVRAARRHVDAGHLELRHRGRRRHRRGHHRGGGRGRGGHVRRRHGGVRRAPTRSRPSAPARLAPARAGAMPAPDGPVTDPDRAATGSWSSTTTSTSPGSSR